MIQDVVVLGPCIRNIRNLTLENIFFFLYHHSIITYGVRFQDRKGSLRCLPRAEIADFLNRKGAFTLSALDLKSSGRGGRLDAD